MSGTITRLHLDRGERTITAETVQDVEPILDLNKALQNAGRQSGDFRHIGTIPNVVLVKWLYEEGANVWRMSAHEFGQFIRRKLNDPDWRHLRTDK